MLTLWCFFLDVARLTQDSRRRDDRGYREKVGQAPGHGAMRLSYPLKPQLVLSAETWSTLGP